MKNPRTGTSVLAGTEPSLLVGVFVTGAGTVLLGPLIPEMLPTWGVTTTQSAVLFVFQFVASAIAALVSSRNLRYSLLGGFALLATGFGVLSTGDWSLAGPGMTLVGLGVGLTAPASNLLLALRNPERRGAALSTINLVWGMGAAGCPLLFAGTGIGLGASRVLLGASVACAAIGLRLLFRLRLPDVAVRPRRPRPMAVGFGRLLPIALMLFLYIGIETTVGGWLVTVAERGEPTPGAVALWIGSGFWAALLSGRALAPGLLLRVREATVLRASLLVAGGGLLLLLTATSRLQVAAGALMSGFGLATVFPLCVSLMTAATHESGSRNTGWMFAVGSVGGALLPWLSAWLASADPAAANPSFLLPAAALLALAALHELHHRLGDGGIVEE